MSMLGVARRDRPALSIVMPALDEAAGIVGLLQSLQPLRARGVEVIVADGGSTDGTPAVAAPLADAVVPAPRGRAAQMNAGAAIARGRVLLFLHADTQLPAGADAAVLRAVGAGVAERLGRADDPCAGQAAGAGAGAATGARTTSDALWGRFDVHIAGRPRLLRVVAVLMNLRSRLTGIATGDQAIFVRRDAFDRVGGYPLQPLMEDIELCRQLKRLVGRPACLRLRVVTSGRRWERHGVWRTIVLMWRLRWRYWRGESPASLARAWR